MFNRQINSKWTVSGQNSRLCQIIHIAQPRRWCQSAIEWSCAASGFRTIDTRNDHRKLGSMFTMS